MFRRQCSFNSGPSHEYHFINFVDFLVDSLIQLPRAESGQKGSVAPGVHLRTIVCNTEFSCAENARSTRA
jgi:hypothetical protein